jgi:hypothetical protein
MKHARDNCRGSNCSVVARIFRISRNDRFHSRRPSCGRDFTRGAFHARQRGKGVDQLRTTSRAEPPV